MNSISHKQAVKWIHLRLDEMLKADQTALLEEHLEACESCRVYSQEIGTLPDYLSSRFKERWDIKTEVPSHITQRVNTQARHIPMAQRFSSGMKLLAGVAALALFAFAMNFVISRWQSAPVAGNESTTATPSTLGGPPSTGLLAFTSTQDGNHEIYTIHADGSGMTNLTDNPANDSNPQWSPDGKRIAFESNRTGSMQIYVMEADGSNLVQLTDNAKHILPVTMNFKAEPWSPDGSTLLVLKQEPGEDLWTLTSITLDGAKETQLVTGRIAPFGISWSPDGNYVGFIQNAAKSNNADDFVPKLYVVRPDGSSLQEITDVFQPNGRLFDSLYSWSEDGESVSLVSYQRQEHADETIVYKVRLDDHSVMEKYSTNSLLNNWQDAMTIAVMPDSTWLSNWARPDGTSRALDPTEHCQPVDPAHSESHISRSSMGSWLMVGYCSNGDHWLYWANADGTTIQQLMKSPLSQTGSSFISFAWSPDDRHVAFNLASHDKTVMYILDVNAALNDPSNQPEQVTIASNEFYTVPSWQPISNREVVDEEPTPDATETLSSEGLLAFVSKENGNAEIYTMRADGSGLTNLTNDPADDSLPFWSPDGQKIAFTSDRDGSNQIYLMDADGSNTTRLTTTDADYGLDANGFSPWSPDGTRLIVYRESGKGGSQIYVLDVLQKTMTELTNDAGQYFMSSWSPDGNHIAFVADTGRIPRDIFLIGSDGNGLVKLTEKLPAGEYFMHWYGWSQDGSSLFFPTEKNQQAYQDATHISTVYKVSPDGSMEIAARSTDRQIMEWSDDMQVHLEWGESVFKWVVSDGSESTLKLCENNGETMGTIHQRSHAGNWLIGSNCSPNGWVLYWTDTTGATIQPLPNTAIPATNDIIFSMQWSADDGYIAFVSFDSRPVDIEETLYVLDVAQAHQDPSTQPLKIAGGSNPSWQPIPRTEVVKATPTPDSVDSSPTLSIVTNIFNGEWIAFLGGNAQPQSSVDVPFLSDVYIMQPGIGTTNLTQSPAFYYNLQWSHDGQQLLFEREDTVDHTIDILRHEAGSAAFDTISKPITDPERYGYRWSPNSDKILFADASQGNYDLYTAYADGRNDPQLTQLTNDPAQDVGFVWSPDGGQIAFQRIDGDKLSIYIMNQDGSDQREIARGSGKVNLYWSQSGTNLYVSTVKDNWLDCEGCIHGPAIYRVDLENSSVHQLYHEPDTDNIYWYLYDTPENTLYFMRVYPSQFIEVWGTWFRADGDTISAIGEMDPHQACQSNPGSTLNEYPSPNKQFSLVVDSCAGAFDLYLADRATLDVTHVTQMPASVEGQGGNMDTIPLRWSPDGRWILYEDGLGTFYLLNIERAMQDPHTIPLKLLDLEALGLDTAFDFAWQPSP